MEDCLSGVRTNVVNRAKAVLQAAFAGDLRGDELAVADQLCISLGRLIDADNVLFRNYENVRRSARLDVFKCEGLLVFIDFL